MYLENQLDYLVSNFAIVKGLVIDEFYNKKMLQSLGKACCLEKFANLEFGDFFPY